MTHGMPAGRSSSTAYVVGMNLLLFGATNLVGGHVLELVLSKPRVTSVTAPVRRAVPDHPKLHAQREDFDHLPHDTSW